MHGSFQGRTCFVLRRTQLLVCRHLLPLTTDDPGVAHAYGGSGGPLDYYGPFSHRFQW